MFWSADGKSKHLVPSSSLMPFVSDEEKKRQDLRNTLANGWGAWYDHNMLATLHLPSAMGFDMGLLHIPSGTYLSNVQVSDGNFQVGGCDYPRSSLAPANVGKNPAKNKPDLDEAKDPANVGKDPAKHKRDLDESKDRRGKGKDLGDDRGEKHGLGVDGCPSDFREIKRFGLWGLDLRYESAVTLDGEVVWLFTILSAASSLSDYALVVNAGFFWSGTGVIQISDDHIKLLPTGLPEATIWFDADSVIEHSHLPRPIPNLLPTALLINISKAAEHDARFSLGTGSTAWKSPTNAFKLVQAARICYESKSLIYKDDAQLYHAMQSVLAWNTIWQPQDGVLTTVSRQWAYPPDNYVIFEWYAHTPPPSHTYAKPTLTHTYAQTHPDTHVRF